MPVHAVAGGFRWGRTGKVYQTRAAAERQARAIYASGYREDRVRARTKREQHRALSASKRAETRYVLDLIRILRGIHEGVRALVDREVLAHPDGWRQDATPEMPPPPPGSRPRRAREALGVRLKAKVLRHVERTVPPVFDKMADQVDKTSAVATSALIGLPIASLAEGIDDIIDDARAANIALISGAANDYIDDIREVLEDPDNEGLRVEELQDLLVERAGVSESRAALIARDQTLKLNAAVAQTRQTAAGVERYTWSTSHDERVRPSHADLDGQEFSWDDPPETNDDGDTNHPGEDFQCRCVAIPLLDDEDQVDEAAE